MGLNVKKWPSPRDKEIFQIVPDTSEHSILGSDIFYLERDSRNFLSFVNF